MFIIIEAKSLKSSYGFIEKKKGRGISLPVYTLYSVVGSSIGSSFLSFDKNQPATAMEINTA